MKKLLVLTDFSANASHAAAAALRLSARLDMDLLLYHTLPYIPLVPTDSDGSYVSGAERMLFDDNRERLMQETTALRMLAAKSKGRHIHIGFRNGDGDLGDVIGELTAETDIEMVIMGGRSGGAMEHLFTGSDTTAVIRKSCKPVWIIPETADWDTPQKVVLATDFGAADLPAVDFLIGLSQILGFQLEVVHVVSNGEVTTEIEPEIVFRKFLAHRNLDCTQVFGADVHHSLHQYCKDNRTDVLAMTHGHHSFIGRLFGHSESRDTIADRQLAVLVFPPGFK